MNNERLKLGDKVRVCNVDLESYGAIGEVEVLDLKTVKVKITNNFPTYWAGNKRTNYSYKSVEAIGVKKDEVKRSNVALFFLNRDDAEEYLREGTVYSENYCFDVCMADTLMDCENQYEKLIEESEDLASDVTCLVFKGVLYQIKRRASFIEVEDQ